MEFLDNEYSLRTPEDVEEPDDEGSQGFSEHKMGHELFFKTKSPIKLDNFNSFFSQYQRALNPTSISEYLRYDYNATNLLYDQLKKSHYDRIDPSVIRSYLYIENFQIWAFENDIDIGFNDADEKGILSETDTPSAKKLKPKKKKKSLVNKPALTDKDDPYDWLRPYLGKNNKDNMDEAIQKTLHDLPTF